MFTSSIFEPDFELYDEQNQYLFDEPDFTELNQSSFLTNYDDLQLSLSDSSDEQDDAPSFDTWPDSPSPPQAPFQQYVDTPEQGSASPWGCCNVTFSPPLTPLTLPTSFLPLDTSTQAPLSLLPLSKPRGKSPAPAPKNNFSVKYMIFPNGLCLTLNQSTSWLKIFKGDSSLNIQVETAMTAEPHDPELQIPLSLCGVEQNNTRLNVDIRNAKALSEKVASCSHFEFTPLNPEKELGMHDKGQYLMKFWGCRFNSKNNTSLMKEIAKQTRMDCFTNKVHHFWLVIVITPNKLAHLQTVCDGISSQ
ncbi:hypothetical protein BLNAU_3075 [Blattamonas nauphoetae]|uniref:Uncharacterized protein n=1 Tax=Blattamonas nauphoetae TaxID=2049346 RepID=A0ABQ9YE77_9EUKA|nr:hypothetical protein BLNAU_3075 [Blattamonas nauphoetae]